MPATPCHQFYMAKLRNQEWIRNDFSDVFVALSDCHSMLRQDDSGKKNEDTKQDFVRNTKKYWVPVEHGVCQPLTSPGSLRMFIDLKLI